MIVYGLFIDDPSDIRYVGITIGTPEQRLARHRQAARAGQQQPVYDWMRKYGVENIHVRPFCRALTHEDLCAAETWMIAALLADGRRLLNVTPGGDGWRSGQQHSDATKRKISESRRGIKFTDEHRQRIADANALRWTDPAERERAAASKRGRPRSAETRAKISKSLMGRPKQKRPTTGTSQ